MASMWSITLASVFLSFGVLNVKNVQSREPSVVRAVPAIYPILAAVARMSDTVIVEVTINADGTVAEATTIQGHEVFTVAAERSARQWMFDSLVDPNHSRKVRITYTFKLITGTSNPEDLLPVFMPPFSLEIRGMNPDYIYDKNIDPPNRSRRRRKR